MKKSLKFISISHHTASLVQRECFHLTRIQQYQWFGLLRKKFLDISGLLILSTCNRTEIYLESKETTADEIRNFFLDYQSDLRAEKAADLFEIGNSTMDTTAHLLSVGNGLQSAIIGDSEIMGQLKQAWQQSIQLRAQGSLLERAIQTVFRTHKRVVNETNFHKGTQSTAYKALKLVLNEFETAELKRKKLLLIGAGDIILNLIKYLPKFNFETVAIANRTAEKSEQIACQNKLGTYDWEKVEANDFEDFDVIISAVSNREKLIKSIGKSSNKRVLIDIAVPANIDPSLSHVTNVKLYNLDTLAATLYAEEAMKRLSVVQVEKRIKEEIRDFSIWLKRQAVRELLLKYKKPKQHRSRYSPLNINAIQKLNTKEFERLVNRISDKLVKETPMAIFRIKPDEISAGNLNRIIELVTKQQNQYEENRSISC